MKHGTRACYQAGCRRAECVEANRAYAREHKRDVTRPDGNGRRRVDAAEARGHLTFLRSSGMQWAEIADRAGTTVTTLLWVFSGKQQSMRSERAERILGIGVGLPERFCAGSEEWHGTLAGRRKHGCTGPECRRAVAEYRQKYRASRRFPFLLEQTDVAS